MSSWTGCRGGGGVMLEPAGTASDDGDKKKATKTKRAGKNRIAGVGES